MILNDLQRFTFLIFLCFPFIFLDYGFFVSKYNLFNYPEFINFFRLITNIGDGILLLPFLALFFILSKFGGIQLIAIGIFGRYLARINDNVLSRSHYIISRQIK
ncbi:MAG: hypothetical protein ACJ0P0_10440 [Flavobacteriaceae bacterium]